MTYHRERIPIDKIWETIKEEAEKHGWEKEDDYRMMHSPSGDTSVGVGKADMLIGTGGSSDIAPHPIQKDCIIVYDDSITSYIDAFWIHTIDIRERSISLIGNIVQITVEWREAE